MNKYFAVNKTIWALFLSFAGSFLFRCGRDAVILHDSEVKKLADGFQFTEGPAADKNGNVFFTDIPKNRIHKWTTSEKLILVRENSGGANGLFFDREGNLLACEGENRQLTSMTPEGRISVLVNHFQSKHFNRPNDLWIHPNGGIYFTDPAYGKQPEELELDWEGVYYLPKGGSEAILVDRDMRRPNGLIGTPNGKTLYVTDHGADSTWVYRIGEDGRLADKSLFVARGSDGMTMDERGNVYLTTDVVEIYAPDGSLIVKIEIPERPANVCFGGRDRQTLFITARTSLYSVRMQVKGVQ